MHNSLDYTMAKYSAHFWRFAAAPTPAQFDMLRQSVDVLTWYFGARTVPALVCTPLRIEEDNLRIEPAVVAREFCSIITFEEDYDDFVVALAALIKTVFRDGVTYSTDGAYYNPKDALGVMDDSELADEEEFYKVGLASFAAALHCTVTLRQLIGMDPLTDELAVCVDTAERAAKARAASKAAFAPSASSVSGSGFGAGSGADSGAGRKRRHAEPAPASASGFDGEEGADRDNKGSAAKRARPSQAADDAEVIVVDDDEEEEAEDKTQPVTAF